MNLYHLRTALMLTAMVVALVELIRLRGTRNKTFLVITLITAMALPVEALGYVTTIQRINNAPLYNLFTWAEFLLLLYMIQTQRPHWTKVLSATAILGSIALILAWTWAGSITVIFIEGIVVVSLLLALLLGALLWSLANRSVDPLHRVPGFWLFMGLLLYFAALPPVVALARTVDNPTMATALWTIMPVLCTLRYLLTAYASRLQRRQPHDG